MPGEAPSAVPRTRGGDPDGIYDSFKTLGAKRYMYKQGNDYHITIAGTNKHLESEYIKTLRNPFNAFNDGLIIPPQFTGKLTHTYIDETKQGVIIDYKGVSVEYNTLSGIHMEQCEYNLGLASSYIDYLQGVKETWK